MIDLKQTEIYVYKKKKKKKKKKKSLKRITTDPEQNNTKNSNRDDLNQRFHFWKEPKKPKKTQKKVLISKLAKICELTRNCIFKNILFLEM
jgi:hypothetical protein